MDYICFLKRPLVSDLKKFKVTFSSQYYTNFCFKLIDITRDTVRWMYGFSVQPRSFSEDEDFCISKLI